MPVERCNPIDLWRSLTPQQQERLGALAIATELAAQGATSDNVNVPWADTHAFEITDREANGELTDLVVELLPDAYQAIGEPKRPDLNALGIRQCVECGCTDRYACTPPCDWYTECLCTACVLAPNAA